MRPSTCGYSVLALGRSGPVVVVRKERLRGPIMSYALWIIQGLLGLFFILGSGAPKLVLPAESLPMPIPLPG